MTTRPTSGTKSTNALDMSVVVEDAGKDVGHDDDGRLMGRYQ